MPKIHAKKEEIKAYYETHNESTKEVAEKFGIPIRTLTHWISTEEWVKGRAMAGIIEETLSKNLVRKEFGSALRLEALRVKNQMRENLGGLGLEIDEMVLNNILEDSTDKLLLGAMGLNYIQKNIALSAIIARDELLKLKSISDQNPSRAEPLIIASAEKTQKIFVELKNAIYGKDFTQESTNKSEDLSGLSNAELEAILNS